MPDRVRVTSAEFIRNIGYWQTEALRSPISITHHGRERLILAAAELFLPRGEEATSYSQEERSARIAYSAIIENLEDGFLAFDAQLSLLAINSLAEAIMAATREELLEKSLPEAAPGVVGAVLQARLQRVVSTRRPERVELTADNGSRITMKIFPIGDGAGVILRNSSEEHQLRQQREDREALDRAVSLHPGVMAIRLDARGRIEAVDKNFAEVTGFRPEDVSGHRFFDILQPECRRPAAELFERVLRDGVVGELETVLVGKKGEEMPGLFSVAPVLADFAARGALIIWAPSLQTPATQSAA